MKSIGFFVVYVRLKYWQQLSPSDGSCVIWLAVLRQCSFFSQRSVLWLHTHVIVCILDTRALYNHILVGLPR